MAKQSFPAAVPRDPGPRDPGTPDPGPPLPVLVTRPEPQASRFAADLIGACGARVQVFIAPLMRAEEMAPPLPPGPFAALLLTSETGAAALDRLAPARGPLPQVAFCIGVRTASAARARGVQPLAVAPDAAGLVALLADRPDAGPLLWLRGEDRAADLPALLPGLRIAEAVVYAQRPCPLTDEARALLSRPGPLLLPLFSPRSVRVFLAAAPDPVARLLPVAISPATAAALPAELRARAGVADTPDAPGMLQAIGRVLLSRLP